MAFTRLSTKATFVKRGFGQVEPNHLSAQATKEIYAQLPCAPDIYILENGQFAKYDYANGVVNYTGPGDWLLVFNEIKLYHPYETDEDFALIKRDYNARAYSPVGQNTSDLKIFDNRLVDENGETLERDNDGNPLDGDILQHLPLGNYYERGTFVKPQLMPEGTKMVPRLFATKVGDIFTTNTIKAEPGSLAIHDILKIDSADGYLSKDGDSDMQWEVVKVYTMPDLQPGVKIIRIK